MGVPAGYVYKDGGYWNTADSSGPYGITPAGVAVPMFGVAYVGVLASRPAANSVPAGTEIILTDIGYCGYSRWKSDGADWVPSGQIVLYRETGSVASPLSTVTGDAAANKPFTPPVYGNCILPAELINAKMRVEAKGIAVRGAVATTSSNFLARIGNTPFDTANGGQLAQAALGATASLTGRIEGYASFSSLTNAVVARVPGVNASNATGVLDVTLSDLSTNPAYITFAMSATLAVGETVSLVRYEVTLS